VLAREWSRGTRFEVSDGMAAVDPRVRYVLALMERHHAAPLPIAELARAVNVSPAHLRRMFQQELGRSPARVSRELRLDHARRLLQTSFLTVKQVMAESGWNDPSHFCREFKRRHGQNPQSLRGDVDDPVMDDDARR
jgi:AraC family transcriptional regulator of arabinose operon